MLALILALILASILLVLPSAYDLYLECPFLVSDCHRITQSSLRDFRRVVIFSLIQFIISPACIIFPICFPIDSHFETIIATFARCCRLSSLLNWTAGVGKY
ncbi:hypothetical protein F5884DRAFT_812815 [Xylogone sp. PMI_703]|nr:hypothetical protein F5884DRAFT_812815 [Xylogone sp. PMI_703]